MAATPTELTVRDLGRMNYSEALSLQRSLQQEVIAARTDSRSHPGFLLMVEHDPPVITVSRRAEAADHLIATRETLTGAGIEVRETDRGGDITYHGPGQLVVYPILDLNRLGLRLHGYMRWLEDRVLEVLATCGISGHRDDSATGVWVGPSGGDRKICAMGVRVSRWVSMHGLALNVDPDLTHFDLIVPCGLHGRGVTSMRRERGDACPDMGQVKQIMVDAFNQALDAPPLRSRGN
ncbi:MAG: lipoyl(octanoyl) transferase LipB [Phycisphaerales bacterium]|jgi:lipoyl(octanoyl) transferase|nr:lipoyl(octanoyl) transferase LipB [Phycisphaerales bacterium]